jgi:hypothetical protein
MFVLELFKKKDLKIVKGNINILRLNDSFNTDLNSII